MGPGSLSEVRDLEAAIAKQSVENETLRQRNLALEAEVRDLKQGFEAVEERARYDLGMVKEGELFIQIVEPAEQKSPEQGADGKKP